MLQYRRRNTNTPIIQLQHSDISDNPLLTYCNWSYNHIYHIDLDTLKIILTSFDKAYIPFYLRIFNETPAELLESFTSQYNISKSSLLDIRKILINSGFRIKTI